MNLLLVSNAAGRTGRGAMTLHWEQFCFPCRLCGARWFVSRVPVSDYFSNLLKVATPILRIASVMQIQLLGISS